MRDNIIKNLRKQIVLSAISGGGGHIAPAFSALEILWTLYGEGVLNVRPDMDQLEGRDRLIISKGHCALALYVCLAHAGFFPEEELWTFTKPGSRLGGEPMLGIPGVEAATGSLGHGLSYGVGIALGMKKKGLSAHTYVLVGDGECQEGSIWEAVGCASALKLDRLTAIMDCNKLQKMDTIEAVYGEVDWVQRWSAFGWQVIEADGHDIESLKAAFSVPNEAGKPKLIIAHTVKGHGVSVMENAVHWHYKLPNKRELKACVAELGITQEELDYAKSVR